VTAVVGVSDHAGWAVLMTVGRGAKLLDRRRVTLLDDGLPALPYHHEAQVLSDADAIELVNRVRASAERHARTVLDALAFPIAAVALRRCPELPPTIPERIANYRAQCVADSVMYRTAIADAARARDWAVAWYDPKRVFADAARALRRPSIEALLRDTGKALGPPWQKDHRLAMAAAIAGMVGAHDDPPRGSTRRHRTERSASR
jgi:hypothetical protein